MKNFLVYAIGAFVFLAFANNVHANENKFITVVNPVRIAPYTVDVSQNISAQYGVTNSFNIPATWLLTYDVLQNEAAVEEINKFDSKQELGLFLEVGEALAKDSGVKISEGSWQFANVIFLSGYVQEDRMKLIDTLFEKFKDKFGYYPKSVGSWWTDSYSLNYIHEKYGISANLTVADQFSTDRYQVWGQYWGMPFYPSKYHSAIPASSIENKLPVVMLQWAPRDPINGYYSSLYSTQDYHMSEVGQDINYFTKIVSLYLNDAGEYGQVTIGVEGDLSPAAYHTHYYDWLNVANDLEDSGVAKTVTMSDFANWYNSVYPDISPSHLIHTRDLEEANKEVVWYQNATYRVGILSDSDQNEVKIIDYRIYSDKFHDPYYQWPNRSFNLSINVPSIYDEISYSENVLKLSNDSFSSVSKNDEGAFINLESGKSIQVSEDGVDIIDGDVVVQSIKAEHTNNEYKFRAFTPEFESLLQSKKVAILIFLLTTIVLFLLYKKRNKLLTLIVVLGITLAARLVYVSNTQEYLVSQSEVDALNKLKGEGDGKILVYDNSCLYCERYGMIPAAFVNRRDYIGNLSGKRVIYNKAFFEEKEISKAKDIFSGLAVDYIYLVTYGGYSEKLPVSPGDIEAIKIYSNANAEIWKVKNDN